MYARGDAVRAAVILSQGLKRDPSDAEAVEWLLHLYVEEVPNPGMESAVLQVLARQSNGGELLEIVEAELAEIGAADKLRAIDKVLDLEGITFPEPAPPEPEPGPEPEPDPEPASVSETRPSGGDERWEAFDDPYASGVVPAPAAAPQGARGSDRNRADQRREPRAVDEADPLSLSQPLGTLDTLPDDLRAEYAPSAPLPSERAAGTDRSGLIIVAIAAFVVIAAVALYALKAGTPDEPPATWEEEGSGE